MDTSSPSGSFPRILFRPKSPSLSSSLSSSLSPSPLSYSSSHSPTLSSSLSPFSSNDPLNSLSLSSSSIPPPTIPSLSRSRSISSPSFSSLLVSSSSPSPSPSMTSSVSSVSSILSSSRPATPSYPSSCPSSPVVSRPRTTSRRASAPTISRNRLAYKMSKCNCKLVRSILETHGMFRCDKESSEWTIMWNSGHVKQQLLANMGEYQKINHFPGSYEITRKDRLHSNMHDMMSKFGEDNFNFIPPTFILPEQQEEFKNFCKEENEKRKNKKTQSWHEAGETGPWIAKPIASSRGRGIFVFDNMKDILEKENTSVLVSHYVPNPFLINGIKFDLRLYVLVTSYDPLRIYIHQEGLGRFATEKYVKSSKNFSDKFMHLTNYSVNKTNINFIQNADADVDNVGSKWSLSAVKEHLSSVGVDVKKLMESIRSIVVKTIMSVQPYISSKFNDQVPFRHNCFELYGFDVLIDENLTPWLLEVNLSPSLSTDSPLDLKIKSSVICDLLNMVGIFNTQPTTSFPTKQKLPFSESGQPTQSPYLDFVSDEFSFRGGFELAFPARDWETYLPFLERNENTRFYPAIVERLFGGLRRARNPNVKKKSLRNSTGRRSLSPQKDKPKEKEKEKDEKEKEKEREKEKDASRSLFQKASNLNNVGPPLRRELSKTLLSPSPSLHSHPLSVSINSRSLHNSKSPQLSPSPTFNSSLSPSIPFPSSPILPTSPTSPTLLRAARSSYKNLNVSTNEFPTDYVIPLAPTTYSPFRVAPRDIFGNIVADSNTIEEKQTPKPKTPPPLNPHNETLLKLLESKLEEDTNKTTRNHFQDIELQPIHAREIFTVYLQRLASRLSSLSQKTVYDQFYSTSSHLDFQKFNFSEISDNIQLVHLVEKFLNSTANSSFSPLSVPRAPTPLSRSATPVGNTGESNIINTGKPPLRRSLSSGKKEEFSNILLSQKASQVLRSLETYITNYKLQTNTFKKKHHFNSSNDKETEWVEWERFVQLLNGYSDKDLESLISRFGEGENHIHLPV